MNNVTFDFNHIYDDIKEYKQQVSNSNWYANLPLTGRIVGPLYSKYYGNSTVEKIKTIKEKHKTNQEFLSNLMQSRALTADEMETINKYCCDMDKFFQKIEKKEGIEKKFYNQNWFKDKLFQRINNADLFKIMEEKLSIGLLPSRSEISQIKILFQIMTMEALLSNPIRTIQLEKLKEIEQIIDKYNFLSELEEKLKIMKLSLNQENPFYDLINKIKNLDLLYIGKFNNRLFFQKEEIETIYRAIDFLNGEINFEKEYPLYYQLINKLDLCRSKIKNRVKYHFDEINFFIHEKAEDKITFFKKLILEDIEYAMYIFNHLPISNWAEKYELEKIFEILFFYFESRKFSKEEFFNLFSNLEEKQLFLSRIHQYTNDIDHFICVDLKIKYILDQFDFLMDENDKLRELVNKCFGYINNSFNKDDKYKNYQLFQCCRVVNQLLSISHFEKYHPKIAKIFNYFDQKFSIQIKDLPDFTIENILSYVSQEDFYSYMKLDVISEKSAESIFARRVPQVFGNLLDDLIFQFKEIKRHRFESATDEIQAQAVIAKLKEMQIATKTQALPKNIEEALNYLKTQKDTLILVLSLANLGELSGIKLPCTQDLINGKTGYKVKDFYDNCPCEIHDGLDQSITQSFYNYMIHTESKSDLENLYEVWKDIFLEKLFKLDPSKVKIAISHLINRDPDHISDHPIFVEIKVENILNSCNILTNEKNKIDELRLKLFEYRRNIPKNTNKIEILKNYPQLFQLYSVVEKLLAIPLLDKYQAEFANVLSHFYQKFFMQISDMPHYILANILSYLSDEELYNLNKSKALPEKFLEPIYLNKVPEVFCKLLQKIKNEFILSNKYHANSTIQVIISRLTDMEADTKTQALPENLEQAINYLKTQKEALILVLSLATPHQLSLIRLPCTKALIKGSHQVRYLSDNCVCEIHDGLSQSVIQSIYNQIIHAKTTYDVVDIDIRDFFRKLVVLDKLKAKIAIDYLTKIEPNLGITAKKYC